MATLTLVKNTKKELFLYSTEPSENAEFSVFDIDGEGSGSPFDFECNEWFCVDDISEQEYLGNDQDSFWDAQQKILKECIEKGIALPDYVGIR